MLGSLDRQRKTGTAVESIGDIHVYCVNVETAMRTIKHSSLEYGVYMNSYYDSHTALKEDYADLRNDLVETYYLLNSLGFSQLPASRIV
jgi:hypothetical protein